jgi:hypothetical protein
MKIGRRKSKKDDVKPIRPKPYDREKEGKGTCSECKVTNGHRAGCYRAGT